MECRRCNFENVPDATRCLRCGAALVAPAGVSVTPGRLTRAPGFRPALGFQRAWGAFFRRLHTLAASVNRLLVRLRIRREKSDSRPALALALSAVPGLGHFLTRGTAVGFTILLVWLGLLVATVFHPWALGGAIALHAAALTDVYLFFFRPDLLRRILLMPFFLLLLWFALYWPGRTVLDRNVSHFWLPWYTVTDTWHRNDPADFLVVFTHHGRPLRGDLVRYHVRDASAGEVYVLGGTYLGYVLAYEGETVSFEGARVNVNGEPISPRLGSPTAIHYNWMAALLDFSFSVPPGKVFILPAVDPGIERLVDAGTRSLFMAVCVRDASEVSQRAFFIASPLSRFGPI